VTSVALPVFRLITNFNLVGNRLIAELTYINVANGLLDDV
jgi:hypothetical protein